MNAKQIESKFAEMGARFRVLEAASPWHSWDRRGEPRGDYAMDIQRDRHGQFFELRVPKQLSGKLDATVMQSEPRRRHLLLLVRRLTGEPLPDRFLCGHDEREWFVAAVPGGASSVGQAMDTLQPDGVREALAREQVSWSRRHARKNPAFRRQGEWFFLPEPSFVADENFILRHEPLRRGAGKPHFAEELVRSGGEAVYVCFQHPNGLREREYRRLLLRNAEAPTWRWRALHRNMEVHVRGTVRHPDHATIILPFWHRVLMNTETRSRTMANVAFLD